MDLYSQLLENNAKEFPFSDPDFRILPALYLHLSNNLSDFCVLEVKSGVGLSHVVDPSAGRLQKVGK